MGFVEKIFEQTFSNHPYLFLFIILVTGSGLTHSYNVFAQKVGVDEKFEKYAKSVDTKFTTLEDKIDSNRSELLNLFSKQAIRDYTSEIHALSELENSGKANQRDRKRLRELQQDLDDERTAAQKRQHGIEL